MAQLLIRPAHEPPVNEIPAVLATPEFASRADHIALAIPSLLVYSTGTELLILCRYREPWSVSIEDRQETARRMTERTREIADQLPRLITVNAKPVEMLGGLHDQCGFTYRAWARFRPEAAGADLVLSLSWPGVPTATRTVEAAEVADAKRRVVTLWPPGGR
jgi:hypothetical protein